MNILGINAFHGDASAALLVDGNLKAALEEERFNRIKHCAGFPSLSVLSCLDGTDSKELDLKQASFQIDTFSAWDNEN